MLFLCFFERFKRLFVEVLKDLSTSRSSYLKELEGMMEKQVVVVVVVVLLLLCGLVPYHAVFTKHRKSC